MAELREAEITKLSTQSGLIREAGMTKSLNAPGTTSMNPNGAHSEKVHNPAASAEPVYIDLLLLGKWHHGLACNKLASYVVYYDEGVVL